MTAQPTSTTPTGDDAGQRAAGGVQSVERSFTLLEHMANAGGDVTLSELAAVSGLPLPTIHRLIRTLVNAGYVRQEPSRRYTLGPRLIRLGESAGRMLGNWARPHLTHLVESLGETANLAMLDGEEIVYVAQVPSKHAMRMFTEVGRRVLPHCTGVGKALLAELPNREVEAILKRTGMPVHTATTLTEPAQLLASLDTIRERGYAVDEGEQEVGVRCVAVVVGDAPARVALSISGPAARVTDELVQAAAPALQAAATAFAADLADGGST